MTDSAIDQHEQNLPGCLIDRSSERFVDLSGWDFPQSLAERSAAAEFDRTSFSGDEWVRIIEYAKDHAGRLGFPEKQKDSLLLGSINIRKLGRRPAPW